MATGLEEKLKPVKPCLKIDFVLHPAYGKFIHADEPKHYGPLPNYILVRHMSTKHLLPSQVWILQVS